MNSLAFWFFWVAKLNRLLRNRVSAQQARERKKAYLSDLEVRVKDLEQKNSELEERLSTLQNENQMLRHVCYIILLNYPTSYSSSLSIIMVSFLLEKCFQIFGIS